MRMNEIDFEGSPPIDGYGDGFFRIAEQVVQGDLIVSLHGVQLWGGLSDPAPLAALSEDIDVLLLGCGADVLAVPTAFRDAIEQTGIGLESMSTPSACRTYNVLLSEGRRVAAALIAVSPQASPESD